MSSALALSFLLACSGPSPAPAAAPASPPAAADETQPSQPGTACLSIADCGPDMVCEGSGCGDDQPGTCQPNLRMCTRDMRPYCGCDGETFLSSGSCPGARYSAPMPCPGDSP